MLLTTQKNNHSKHIHSMFYFIAFKTVWTTYIWYYSTEQTGKQKKVQCQNPKLTGGQIQYKLIVFNSN